MKITKTPNGLLINLDQLCIEMLIRSKQELIEGDAPFYTDLKFNLIPFLTELIEAAERGYDENISG